MSARTLHLGELAHIVGQGVGARSPRGGYPLDPGLRDEADNLMLLCANQHGEIDAQGALDVFTVERLRRLKQEHEDRIRHLTGTAPVPTVLGVVCAAWRGDRSAADSRGGLLCHPEDAMRAAGQESGALRAGCTDH